MLGVKTEFDLAHRSNTGKIRDIENLCAADHQILVETSRNLEEVMDKASGWLSLGVLIAQHVFCSRILYLDQTDLIFDHIV